MFTLSLLSCRNQANKSIDYNPYQTYHQQQKDFINMESNQLQTVVFGGGCFWCVEVLMQQIKGVKSVEPGYAGGHTNDPSYKEVCSGLTGHAEVVKVVFDPDSINLATLLEIFMTTHDPTTLNRQGGDVGTQYRSVIFYDHEEQKKTAQEVLDKLKPYFDQPIVTTLEALTNYYKAEDYHHNYYNLNPEQGYCRAVISPKINKLRKIHSDKLK